MQPFLQVTCLALEHTSGPWSPWQTLVQYALAPACLSKAIPVPCIFGAALGIHALVMAAHTAPRGGHEAEGRCHLDFLYAWIQQHYNKPCLSLFTVLLPSARQSTYPSTPPLLRTRCGSDSTCWKKGETPFNIAKKDFQICP
ncbi:hypothetical protein J1605_012329 [Eschrichtius robustus]|uniref:Uncharacterized protein n=1 Tax=Eschrichtius robustus TaxID=9764 RepID=A0AB34GLW4_ESCRO|nr:hypothetical protein J1605_012329 [Eschrichtius robustus]